MGVKLKARNDDPWRDLERAGDIDWLKVSLAIAAAVIIAAVSFWFFDRVALARDDGRYADNPLHSWFDQLASGKGLCCAFADGAVLKIDDWQSHDGGYQVKIFGHWIDVPESAVINAPNKAGEAYVWPYIDSENQVQIRCFLPGPGA